MLLGFVFIVMAITMIQERRTERTLEALRDLSSPRALVMRDGVAQRIPGREVVRGDLMVVAEGDRIAADSLLRRGTNLAVDESLLTGEPVPVRKRPAAATTELARPGGDDSPALYSGTLVTAGQGYCEVLHTGAATQLGRIGSALKSIAPTATPLQAETARVVRLLAIIGLGACAAVIVIYAVTRGGSPQVWKQGLLAGIAMAMAILPEEFPVILTVFLALGAWRISRSRVLTRRMPAIEALGAATVLCVDKTGTLTENRMRLAVVTAGAETLRIDTATAAAAGAWPEPCRQVLAVAILASRVDPFDPMERALVAAAPVAAAPDGKPAAGEGPQARTLVREYPLHHELLAVSQVWQQGDGAPLQVASKGAPEAIAGLCRFTAAQRSELEAAVQRLAAQGLRVLGVAGASLARDAVPEQHRDLQLAFLGLIGFEDPLRADVPPAVAECRSAGIRVVMITGDYPVTAQCIARQAGLEQPDSVLTGPELEQLSDPQLAGRIGAVQVYARVVPEQKLRLVNVLKARGEIVAMTGDGVNDAPALKAAHIGIAMGGRGTDVAREAASLVLLDDDFSSIVAAIRLGRRIYDNIRKAVGFTVAVHVPIAGLSMVPVFFASWPLLLLPIHIALLELIINPTCSLVFEAEAAEPDIMRRAPRKPDARLFSPAMMGVAVAQGLSVLAVCLAIFMAARPAHGADAARALTFASLVVGFVVIILINRSWTRSLLGMLREPNAALWWVIGGAGGFLAVVLLVPAVQRLAHFAPLHAPDLALSVAAGVGCLMWFELLKRSAWSARAR
jgi:Ca2+-transporting ATPase